MRFRYGDNGAIELLSHAGLVLTLISGADKERERERERTGEPYYYLQLRLHSLPSA